MTTTKKPKIPDGHPIRKVWEANEKLRSTTGKVELAQSGDTYAARQLMAAFINQVRLFEDAEARGVTYSDHSTKVESNELTRYFRDCFQRILEGEDPKTALNIGGKRRNTSRDIQRKARIGYAMAQKIQDYGRGGYERAKEETAKEFLISEGDADRAYQTYMLGNPK